MPQPAGRAGKFCARIFWDFCWIVAVAGAVTAVSRLLAHDAHLLLVWANSFSLYLYLPSLGILLLATLRGRRRLAAVSLVPVVCGVIWIAPDFRAADPIDAQTAHAVRLRVFSANLYTGNDVPQAILDEIEAADPDVIILQEYSSGWHRAFGEARLEQRYSQQVIKVRDDAFGMAVYSKRPLIERTIWMSGEVPMISVTVQLDDRPLRIYGWHPLPPRSIEYVNVWNAQYEDLMARLAGEHQATLIIGDFNATGHAYWMHRLEAAGFRSAHAQCGRGYAVTFPNGTSRVPPIRVDHAFYSRALRCLNIREGEGAGSDHKPLIAEFVWAE